MRKYYIGLDIGGTSVKGGIIDIEGNTIVKQEIMTESKFGTLHILDNIEKLKNNMLVSANLTEDDCVGIGMGLPGIVDNEENIVVFSNTLKWSNFDVKKEFGKRTTLPIKIDNDANLATLGETLFGSGKGAKHAILLTLGTGVGSGFVLNGKIYSGNKGCGAEFGHSILVKNGDKCACGRLGCVEAYASATAFIKYSQKLLSENPQSAILESIENLDDVTPKIVFSYKGKDQTADDIINRYISYLADAILQLCDTLRPEVIMLGGGVSNAGNALIEPLQKIVDERIFASNLAPKVPIKKATLGNDAGYIGAASLFI